MPEYETKLKLGRKLEGVSAEVASNNQVSALFRYDEAGKDAHVSLSVESDTMTPDDVVEVLKVLEERGVFTAKTTRTWVSQPQASEAKFGKTTVWQGKNLQEVVQLLSLGLSVRTAPSTGSVEESARLRAAKVKVQEMERVVGEVKAALE